SPSATTPDLATLQDNNLVWRTSSSFEPESVGYAALLAQMETHPGVREALGLSSTAPIKVAVVAKGDSYGKGLADLLSSTLTFNGTTAASNGAAYYARFDFPDFTTNPNAETQSVVNGIVQNFKPNIILAVGTAEVIVRGLAAIEEQWITGAGAQPRPFYVFSEGAKLTQLASDVTASEATHSDRKLKTRVQVFGPRYNERLYGLLQSRYSAASNGQAIPDAYGITGSYDAFYLIAYALVANGTGALSGTAVSEGLKHMVAPGIGISAGPYDISQAMAELVAGRNIDFDGVTGKLDFDVATGDAPGDYNLYCVESGAFAQTGQYFISSERRMIGEYAPCP
ncbi:MAG TPA: hypothetical protein VIV60_28325, partial [Polyangiaceae bacterium]